MARLPRRDARSKAHVAAVRMAGACRPVTHPRADPTLYDALADLLGAGEERKTA